MRVQELIHLYLASAHEEEMRNYHTTEVRLHLQQLHTILRLIDLRVSSLKASWQIEQDAIDEAVGLTKLRLEIQDHVNKIENKRGC